MIRFLLLVSFLVHISVLSGQEVKGGKKDKGAKAKITVESILYPTTKKQIVPVKELNFDYDSLFMRDSYSNVLEKALEDNKLVLIDVTGASCEPCKRVHSALFTNPDFIAAVDTGYVVYKIDIEKNANHSVIAKLDTASMPHLVVLSPWGHLLQVYTGYRSPSILSKSLNKIHELVQLERVFAAVEMQRSVENSDAVIAAGAMLNLLSKTDRILKKDLEASFLGQRSSWDTAENRKFIFDWVGVERNEEVEDYFLSHLDEFKLTYPKEEVNMKIYQVALLKYAKAENFLVATQNFLKKNIQEEADLYNSLLMIHYYTYLRPDQQAKLGAQLNHLTNFPESTWDQIKSILVDMTVEAEWKDQLTKIQIIHDRYRSEAIDYEWLDLKSLLLYQSGNEKAAYNLLNEIKALAAKQGISYRPSIYRLRE